jgi:anti-sigma factor (TIGR02949 family)
MGAPEVGDCGCDGVFDHLWAYLDHEAAPRTCAELEAHVRTCAYCQKAVQFNEQFKKLVRRCADPSPAPAAAPPQLRAKVQAIIKIRRTLS